MKDIKDLQSSPLNRRELLRAGGVAGIGLLGSTLVGAHITKGASALLAADNDVAILNFALNLEYLEAEYYLRGMTGEGLSTDDKGTNPGGVKGGKKVEFTTADFRDIASEICDDEVDHVQFLRQALGEHAISRPAINFTDAFNGAAKAAGIGDAFDPFADEASFLLGAFVFEDVGVTAYHGGAAGITDKVILSAAAGILGTEAYHAGILRRTLSKMGDAVVANAQKISDLRASVGGGNDEGLMKHGKTNLVPTDRHGITFARTVREVLNIVYLAPGADKGGFYPEGMNSMM